MAKKLKSYRLDEGLLGEVAAYAAERKCSETVVVEAGIRALLDLAKGGVPDLPDPKPAPKVKVAASSVPANPLAGRQARLNREMGWTS